MGRGSTRDTSTPVRDDRRRRRHLQSLEEILEAALAVMRDEGVAGLNLSEVARRVGLRQSSLYQYVDSKAAVYDALFERGMRRQVAVMREAASGAPPGLAAVEAAMTATVRFAVENPVLAQLLFTRAVPGFVPSPEAYAPSLAALELLQGLLDEAVKSGELDAEAATEQGRELLIALVTGVSSQQLANEPDADFGRGRYIRLLEPALAMFANYYAPARKKL